MQLILLSAGKGSRLPKNFRSKPKCLVKIETKTLLDYNVSFYKKFKNKIAIVGYKQNILKRFTRDIGFKNLFNKKYATTNMVHSLFLAKEYIKRDVVIIYGDIIFNKNIYNLLKIKKNIVPVYTHWLENWRKRMSIKDVLKDAESLIIKKKKIIEIGKKINKKKFPKYQFMGILKLKKKTFFKCYEYYKLLRNQKIDMTSFINFCIKDKIMQPEIKIYKSYWYEIDNINDFKYAQKEIKKW